MTRCAHPSGIDPWGIALSLASLVLSACAGAAPPTGDAAPERVVVLAPAAAEILEALGLSERVVGIGEFGPWPEPMAGLPRVGGYDRPNVEAVLSLRCDLLLTAESEAGDAARRDLERLGLKIAALDTSTERGVFEALGTVGALFDRREAAGRLAETMRAELDTIARQAEGAPPRRVLFVVGRNPVFVAGPGSHIDEMIRRVGGVNVAADAGAPYQQFSMEALLERRPDVIIDTSDNRSQGPFGRHAGDWARWPFLPAVREDRVYRVAPGRLVIPGLRLPEMTRRVGRIVQPERFGEADAADLGPLDPEAENGDA